MVIQPGPERIQVFIEQIEHEVVRRLLRQPVTPVRQQLLAHLGGQGHDRQGQHHGGQHRQGGERAPGQAPQCQPGRQGPALAGPVRQAQRQPQQQRQAHRHRHHQCQQLAQSHHRAGQHHRHQHRRQQGTHQVQAGAGGGSFRAVAENLPRRQMHQPPQARQREAGPDHHRRQAEQKPGVPGGLPGQLVAEPLPQGQEGAGGQGQPHQQGRQQGDQFTAQHLGQNPPAAGAEGLHHRAAARLFGAAHAGGQVDGATAQQHHHHDSQLPPQGELAQRPHGAQPGVFPGVDLLVHRQGRAQGFRHRAHGVAGGGNAQLVADPGARAEDAGGGHVRPVHHQPWVHAVKAGALVRFADQHLTDQQGAFAHGDELAGGLAEPVQGGAGQPHLAGGRAVGHRVGVTEAPVGHGEGAEQGVAVVHRLDAGQHEGVVAHQHGGEAGGLRMGAVRHQRQLLVSGRLAAFEDQVAANGFGGAVGEAVVQLAAHQYHGGDAQGRHQQRQGLDAERAGPPGSHQQSRIKHSGGPPPARDDGRSGRPGPGHG